jgi:perosamine synthetase
MKTLALLENRNEPSKQKPFNSIGQEEADAAARVMASKHLSGFIGRAGDAFLGGPCVRQLETDFRDFFGVAHAVSFNSASTALQAAVAALGIGPGDEVITSPYTMSATATAVLLNCAIPVFADIDPQTYCLDPASVEQRITRKTRAILAVNLLGGSADYDELRKLADAYGIRIIEDNAQAPGGRYKGRYTGTIGDIGIFSLNVHKVIQCGEGSVLITNDETCAYRSQLVRNHGEVVVDDLQGERDVEFLAGNNFRLSEIHAAIASEQLKKLDGLNAGRQRLAAYLTEKLSAFPWIQPCHVPADVDHVYYLYPFQFVRERIGISRDTFVKAMRAEGFNAAAGYQKPLYLFPMYQQKRMFPHSQFPFVSTEYPSDVSYAKGICPVAERMYEERLVTTTVYQPPNTEAEVDAFADVMRRIEVQAPALQEYEQRA